ncbi:autotransporter outer membrane beta-barrel domain-containing protein [Fusobacterium varium]|uniref:autotransporter outer membrane beta-barrel domain-containing protein n=1 Tax=Fusobacterium varium TaxID=856 RepID=UPI000E4E3F1A|nr:autotransporter outer membrane beta-barrel domain-containing protein [Fusobacterium varium]RHG32600.1 autotransporter outer membrane beta-barrel domain-containing protein [Fusobacterium varium]
MIEKIIKAVKSSNKRRGRNITIGAVIGFLLSCTAVMGAGDYLWIKGDSGEIKFSINGTTTSDGDWKTENPYENAGNIWDKDTEPKTYTNNMTLSSSTANGKSNGSNISYGLRLSGNLTGVNFINNGSIIGTMRESGSYGYGIHNSAEMGNIENTGVIIGSGPGNIIGYGYGIYNSKTIGDITNTGIINGSGSDSQTSSGYGIYNYESAKITGNITNTGVIIGTGSNSSSSGSGYGIYNESYEEEMENIENKGIIIGTGSGNSSSSGYGIYNCNFGKIGNITNTGIISGTNIGIYNKGYNDSKIGNITNTGVIYGKDNAIKKSNGTIDTAYNYGILVNGDDGKGVVDGLTIVDETPEENKIVNKGLIFTALDGGVYKAAADDYQKFGKTYVDESIVIGYQEDGAGLKKPITREYTIINAKAIDGEPSNIDTEKNIIGTESLKLENGILTTGDSQTINISSDKGYILNGITNTLKVSEGNNELNDSVINAYKTAVVMDSKDSTLILNNTVANGGADKDVPTIKIEGENNTLTLKGESIVNTGVKDNVAITVGGENNVLVLEGNAKVNGEMTSTGNNTLSLNGNAEDGMNMLHNITGFVNMNIHNNVTFFEDVEVTGTKKVTIAETGTLNLRLKNAGSEETVGGENIPKATHAFSGNEMVIQGEGNGKDTAGTLRFITNGIGKKIYVDMKDIELRNLYFETSSVIDGYDVKDKEYIILGAHGSLDGIYKPENTGKDSHRYEALNNIYKGIYSSTDDNLNALRVLISSNEKLGNNYDENLNDEEQLKNLLSYLGSIYTETPYSFSSELSRKSAGMFRDIITENQFKPNLNQWLIMGGLTHRDGGTKDSYYGQNYHGFDTGTADVDVDMKLTGAYALGKYGYSENIFLGVTVGGNKSEAKLPMAKVKGNSGYVGAFAENYRGNLTLKAGAGIQYSEYDANRATLGGHSYSDKYSDMTYDIYLNGRYSHSIGENLFLEPYGTLSYTYVYQEGADEGSKVLAIETDSKSFDYTAAKVGVEIKKVIPHEKGKSTLSAGVSYIRLLTGADEENITGRFKGENATDFDILVAHKNEHSIGLNAKCTLELESGILFDVKGSYSVERDWHNGTGKNRNKGEWIVGAGLGYKF